MATAGGYSLSHKFYSPLSVTRSHGEQYKREHFFGTQGELSEGGKGGADSLKAHSLKVHPCCIWAAAGGRTSANLIDTFVFVLDARLAATARPWG